MAIYTIGDLHLAFGTDKPMDIFPGWQGYTEKLEKLWRQMVSPQDTVVLAGDLSWAMHLENCHSDFAWINSMPGQKLLLKGNHDYWWSTLAKMNRYIADNAFTTLNFVFNNAYLVENYAICGTRGWMADSHGESDEKIMQREAGRLRASLQTARKQWPNAQPIVFLHYPPIYPNHRAQLFIDAMQEYGVQNCYYGHLHGAMIHSAFQKEENGIKYRLVSADALHFAPFCISNEL